MLDTATNTKLSSRFSVFSGWSLSQWLTLVLISGLCIANGMLIKQNLDLKASIANTGKQTEFLKPGERVSPFAANTLSGQSQSINYTDYEKTVLLVFSPQCPACERTLPYWKEIKTASTRNHYQVFGMSLDDASRTSAFLLSNGLDIESFVNINAETTRDYKLLITPQTIVIDNTGKVEKVWPGVFKKEMKAEVEKYFGIIVDDVK